MTRLISVLNTVRVLVVDDDTMNLVRTKMILENDYEVLLADSGIKALDKIKGK